MRTGYGLWIALVVLLISTGVMGQVPATGTRIALIDTSAFGDDKGGITKYVTALNSLDAEFKPVQVELQTMNAKLEAIGKDIQQLQSKVGTPGADSTALQNALSAKNEEGANLQTLLKRKQEDAKDKFDKRFKIVTDPITKEIGDSMEAFRKKNGYDLILDVTKMQGMILAANLSIDVTTAFIKDFNAKAAGIPAQ